MNEAWKGASETKIVCLFGRYMGDCFYFPILKMLCSFCNHKKAISDDPSKTTENPIRSGGIVAGGAKGREIGVL